MGKRSKTFDSKLYSMFIGSVLIPALIAILCFWVYSTYVTVEREEKNRHACYKQDHQSRQSNEPFFHGNLHEQKNG